MKYTPKNKDKARVYTNRVMAGLALMTSLATSYGCVGVRHGLSKSGYGVVKTTDGIARVVTNVSVGEKAGIYSSDPNAPNYKAPEVYTGKTIGDRAKNIATAPVGALEQTLEGFGNILGGIYGATIGQIPGSKDKLANESSHAVKQITNPETKNGVITPTIKYGLDKTREFGCVQKEGINEQQLENRFEEKGISKFWALVLGFIPILNHFGNKSKIKDGQKVPVPIKDRVYDATGEVLYLIPSAVSGGSGGGAGGAGGGISGGNGAGGAGGM